MSIVNKNGISILLALLVPVMFSTALIQPESKKKDPLSQVQSRQADSIMQEMKSRPNDLDLYKKLWSIYLYSGNFRQLIEITLPFYGNSLDEGTEKEIAYAANMLGQSYMALGMTDSMQYYFNISRNTAERIGDIWTLYSVYNGIGINSFHSGANYNETLSIFMKGLEYAEMLDGNGNPEDVILNNIANIYYLKDDTLGLQYALRVYNNSKANGDQYMLISGALTSAYMYYLLGDYDRAFTFVREAASMAEKYHDVGAIYSTYGNILAAMGDYVQAETYFREALQNIDDTDIPATVYLSYGNFLVAQKRYREALSVFEQGLDPARDTKAYIYRFKLYRGISEAYEGLGDDRNALKYHKTYHIAADSIYSIEREHSFNELMIKYETEKKQKKIKEREMELYKERRKLEVTIILLGVIIGIAVVIYILYNRKNRMYGEIVRQHHDYTEKMKRITSEYEKRLVEPEYKQLPGHNDERDRELFARIETEMRFERAYADKQLTIEKLVEKVGSNRTYVSRIINEYSGMSFSNYINSFRIEEAVRILSDPKSDVLLKSLADELGFNTPGTFYRSFHKAVGVPPSKYRQEYMRLYGKAP